MILPLEGKRIEKSPLCFQLNCEPINRLWDILSLWQRNIAHFAAMKMGSYLKKLHFALSSRKLQR